MVLKRVAIIAGLLVLGGFAGTWFVGSMLSAPVPQTVGAAPASLAARNVSFSSESGALIHGWFASVPGSRGVVLLLPGVRANRLSMIERARFLHSAGHSVLLIDLQATGESTGRNITFGWLESRDVIAAVEFIRNEAPDQPIAIIGSSLGGAAALLATPPLRVDAVVLEAVYPTIERATENRLAMRLGPLGSVASPILLAQMRARLGVSAARLRPVDHVGRLDCPVLIIGGALDRHTTKADTLLLYSRARSPKELWLIEDASHVDFHRARRREYERRVLSFLTVAGLSPRTSGERRRRSEPR